MEIKKCLPGSVLKYVALVSMFIDHFGIVIVYRGLFLAALNSGNADLAQSYRTLYTVCRVLGRIAFPIFAFLLTEGFKYTRNRPKYALRLFIFALISQAPFYFAFTFPGFDPPRLNVMFTMLIAFLAMWAMEKLGNRIPFVILISAAAIVLAWFVDCDYDIYGIAVILLFYIFRYMRPAGCGLSFFVLLSMSMKELASAVSMVLINLYNDTRGRQIKYLFYIFYPLHLLVLYLVWFIIFR